MRIFHTGYLSVAICCFIAATTSALVDGAVDPSLILSAREREAQSEPVAVVLAKEKDRRAEAETRAQKIRNLPPEQVRAWVEGRLTEADLTALAASAATGSQNSAVTVTIPRSRMNRLILVSAATVILAVFFFFSRRRERLSGRKQRTVQ